jgi:hypothetical protein
VSALKWFYQMISMVKLVEQRPRANQIKAKSFGRHYSCAFADRDDKSRRLKLGLIEPKTEMLHTEIIGL